MHNKFMEIAKMWLPPGEVSLTLDQTTNINDSHIRVDFAIDPEFGRERYWSRIGTESISESNKNKPTLNVSKVRPDMVLHEFGHALGLVHEHAHKDANIQWNKDVVYRDLKKEDPKLWTKDQVDKWVFEQFDKSKEVITNFDIESVMMYPIRKCWVTGFEPREVPMKLSEGDKATIRKLYPA
jgi:hypothetical protein